MSLLSYVELLELQKTGVIKNSLPEHVNAASIDITLGDTILEERKPASRLVRLSKREPLQLQETKLGTGEFFLHPGEFILAHSEQVFNLSNWLSAEYKLKSSLGRVGLDHMNSGWADAGWTNSVMTLEFKNLTQHHTIVLRKGDRIGQVVFFRHAEVPAWASYVARGAYNNDRTVQGTKHSK